MQQGSEQVKIAGVIFDMDGTLIEPAIDFAAMRRAVGIQKGDLLDTIAKWGDCEKSRKALDVIASFERDAAERMALMPGTRELMDWLCARGVRCAIVTRNNQDTMERAIGLLGCSFEHAIDRSFSPPKPEPDALLHVATQWGCEPGALWMIGDSRHDLLAAQRAGMPCCLVAHPYNANYLHEADHAVERLDELIPWFEA